MTSWTPGHRRVPRGLNARAMHRSPVATAAIEHLMCVVYDCTPEAVEEVLSTPREFEPEEGNSILLSMRWLTKAGTLINLSSLTEVELDALGTFLVDAIERARPSVRERDARAREAEQDGDYRFARSNRPDPKVVVTERKG